MVSLQQIGRIISNAYSRPKNARPYTFQTARSVPELGYSWNEYSFPQRVQATVMLICIPVLCVLAAVGWLIYKPFLSWWLPGLLDRRYQKGFRSKIRNRLPFLFEEYAAEFLPEGSETQRSYVGETIRAGHVRLRFRAYREDLGVSIAPEDMPDDWHELGKVLQAARTDGGRTDYAGFYGASRALSETMPLLESVFAIENRERSKAILDSTRIKIVPHHKPFEQQLPDSR